MTTQEIKQLSILACKVRMGIIESTHAAKCGHPGGSMSAAEMFTYLYNKELNVDPANPKWEARDRFVLSKGHTTPGLYATLANRGYFDKSELLTLNQGGTNLPSHCDMNKTTGIDMTTGSLGQGFSCAVGIALGSKIKKDGATIYTIVGDGESQEGQIWEAGMFASHAKLDNLIAFTDKNGLQIDGSTAEVCNVDPLDEKWRAFGWEVTVLEDGNDSDAIDKAITHAKNAKNGKPKMIILNTVKGKGISFVEAKGAGCHNMNLSADDVARAIAEIRGA